MNLLEEFKGKDTLFESEWLGQKGLENSARYLKTNIHENNFVFCVIIKRNQFNLIVFAV